MLAGIRFGIELGSNPARRSELNGWLAHKARPMFNQRVVAVTEDIMLKWRVMVVEGRRSGHAFAQPDLIIAAGQQHGLTIISRDAPEYLESRVPVFNPWTDLAPGPCPNRS